MNVKKKLYDSNDGTDACLKYIQTTLSLSENVFCDFKNTLPVYLQWCSTKFEQSWTKPFRDNYRNILAWNRVMDFLKVFLHLCGKDYEQIMNQLPRQMFAFKFLPSCVATNREIVNNLISHIPLSQNTRFLYHYQSVTPNEFSPFVNKSDMLVGYFVLAPESSLLMVFKDVFVKTKTILNFKRGFIYTQNGVYTMRSLNLTDKHLSVRSANIIIKWRKKTINNQKFLRGEIFSVYF